MSLKNFPNTAMSLEKTKPEGGRGLGGGAEGSAMQFGAARTSNAEHRTNLQVNLKKKLLAKKNALAKEKVIHSWIPCGLGVLRVGTYTCCCAEDHQRGLSFPLCECGFSNSWDLAAMRRWM